MRADELAGPLRTLSLPSEHYEARRTIGGGEVRDVMPWEGAVRYVTDDGRRYGVEYLNGSVDWLGPIPTDEL
jgi:hypothetical protein